MPGMRDHSEQWSNMVDLASLDCSGCCVEKSVAGIGGSRGLGRLASYSCEIRMEPQRTPEQPRGS